MLQVHGKIRQLKGSAQPRIDPQLMNRVQHTFQRFFAPGKVGMRNVLQFGTHIHYVVDPFALRAYPAGISITKTLQPFGAT